MVQLKQGVRTGVSLGSLPSLSNRNGRLAPDSRGDSMSRKERGK